MGRILNNRYEILEKTDETDRVLIYKARVLKSNRLVTIKVLKQKWVKNKDFVKRFTDELTVMTSLSHTGLISVLDVNYEKGLYYVTMEYFEGMSLYEVIVRDMPLTVPQALNIIMQLGKVLNYALVNGVKFRHIKFSNIIVNRIGRIKVLSFSTPRAITTKSPLPIKEPVGIVSDIFFLGVVLYSLLEGEFPKNKKDVLITDAFAFDPDETDISVTISNRILPSSEKETLESILFRTLTREVSRRYVSIEDMLRDIEDFASQLLQNTGEENQQPDDQKTVREILFGEGTAASTADREADQRQLKRSLEARFGARPKSTGDFKTSVIFARSEDETKLRGESWFSKLNPTVVVLIIAALLLISLFFIQL